LLRSLQEIQPDFKEEAKAYAGLWSQGKKNVTPVGEIGNACSILVGILKRRHH
jgi:hypothetical protein